jgi:hypothetical protein
VKTFSKCFLDKRDCFRVDCDYRLLNDASNQLPIHEGNAEQSDVINRFGNQDLVLAVCTCFLSNSDRFEVIRDFRSLKNGGNPFPVDGSIAEKM